MDTVDAGGALGWCFILCLGLGLAGGEDGDYAVGGIKVLW